MPDSVTKNYRNLKGKVSTRPPTTALPHPSPSLGRAPPTRCRKPPRGGPEEGNTHELFKTLDTTHSPALRWVPDPGTSSHGLCLWGVTFPSFPTWIFWRSPSNASDARLPGAASYLSTMRHRYSAVKVRRTARPARGSICRVRILLLRPAGFNWLELPCAVRPEQPAGP